MRRTALLLLLWAAVLCLHAQNFSRRYARTPLTEALKELDAAQDNYDIFFIYDDLRDFIITVNVQAKNAPDAVRQMIGYYPVSVKITGKTILVECGDKGSRLTGRLVDAKGNPVEYANIALFSATGTTFIAGGVSDRDGRFVIPYTQRGLTARITCMGCKTVWRKVTRANMGTIRMEADTRVLKEVVVNEKLVKHEPGMDVVNAVQLRKGKTNLVDLLQDVPGLIVTDNSIKIPGKGSVKVMFNGRLKRIPSSNMMNILKSYAASNVAKIEIIREPDAKFDAEGNFGVINVITEKRGDYIGGSIGNSVNYNTKWANDMRGNLNYQYKRVTASVNGGWDYGKTPYDESYVAEYSTMSRKSNTKFINQNNDYNATGSLDIMLDSLSTLGIEASYSSDMSKLTGNGRGRTYGNDGQLQEIELTHDFTAGPPKKNLNLSLYLDRNWSRSKSLSFIVDVFRMSNENDYSFDSDYTDATGNMLDKTDRVHNSNSRKLHGVSAALDFNTPLPWEISLSTGLKATLSTTDNGLHYEYSTLPAQDDDFTYNEDVYAAYATLKKQAGRFSFRVGSRYEFTHTKSEPQDGNNTVNDYGRLYPNFVATYSYGSSSSFELSSRSGIQRPALKTLNPFRVYTNAYASALGNPKIKPSHWVNVQLRHILGFKGGELSTSLRYARAFKIIKQVTEMNASDGTMETQWDNAYGKDGVYLDVDLYYTGIKWMRVSLLGSLEYEHSRSNSRVGLSSENDFRPFLYGFMRFFIDREHNLSTSITGSYLGRSHNAMGTNKKSYDLSWSASYSCLKDRLSIKLALKNIFASKYRGVSYSNSGMNFRYNNDFSYRCITFSLSYSFGKNIRTKRKTHSNGDIKQRF